MITALLRIQVRIAVLQLVIDALVHSRGPGFTLLPPARYYDKPKRSLLYMPNTISGTRLTSRNHHANKVASRKWERAFHVTTPWDDGNNEGRARLSFFDVGFKPYDYHDRNPSLFRTALGLRILEEIEQMGDVCGARHAPGKSKTTSAHCYCTVLTVQPGFHAGKHKSGTCTW